MTSHNKFLFVSQYIAKKGLLGKRTGQFGKRGRYVNAQAISSCISLIECVPSLNHLHACL